MSNTTNLGLFKHDNPPTNENQFDVGKSLNENWDKIDEFAGEQKDINSKVTTQGQQIENLNKQYTQLNQGLQAANNQIGVLDSLKAGKAETEKQFRKISTDQERQDKEINGLKDSAINITTDKQKSLHIEDSSNLGAKILPFGNSEQEVRSGKNVLALNFNANTSSAMKLDEDIFTINKNTSETDVVVNYTYQEPLVLEPGTYTISAYVLSGTAKNATSSGSCIWPRLVKEDGTYAFNNVLINCDSKGLTSNQGDYTFTLEEKAEITTLRFYLRAGNVYQDLKLNMQIEKGSTSTEYEKYGASPSPKFPSTIKNVENNINISVFNKNWADANRLAEEMKEHSKTATEEVIDGKNCIVFNNNSFLYSSGFRGLKNNYKENTQYLIKANVRVKDTSVTSAYTLYIQAYDKSGNIIGSKGSEAKGTQWIDLSFVTNENASLDCIGFSYGNAKEWVLDKDSIQIYEANMTKECPVYEGRKIAFPLSEGQRLMLGDYPGTDEKIHHVRKQFELDGTENWQGTSSFYTSYFVDKIADTPANAEILGLCSHFFVYGYNNRKINNLYFHPNKNLHIDNTDNEFYETLEDWKNFLAEQKQKGTPVIIEIELAEEETEDFTEDQKTVSSQLNNADMYKPVTNITTEDNMALIEAQYIADTKTYIDNKYNNLAQQILNRIAGGN